MRNPLMHEMVHGGHDATIFYRMAYGTPGWAKAATFSAGGRVAAQFDPEAEDDDGP